MKQIIVMRTDLKNVDGHKVRSGKLMAQAAHASMKVLVQHGLKEPRIKEWLANSFTKIVVRVDSEQELFEVVGRAQLSGLLFSTIVDNGTTEFGGVPTVTCAAIGPDTDEVLASITGDLKLF